MSSFIGCKISLISKAGIRYEGVLYTIDPKESTVALSKVRSYGTEERRVERVVPGRDEVYEFIIFRGSDIQDLNVCNYSNSNTESASLLQEDSAIVRAETSISNNFPPGVLMKGSHQGGDEPASAAWKSGSNSTQPPSATNKTNNIDVLSSGNHNNNKHSATNTQPIGSNRHNNNNKDSAAAVHHHHNNNTNNRKKNSSSEIHCGNDGRNNINKEGEGGGKQGENYSSLEKKEDKFAMNSESYEYDKYHKYNNNNISRYNSKYYGDYYSDNQRDYNNYERPSNRYRKADQYSQDKYYYNENNKLRGFESADYLSRDYHHQSYSTQHYHYYDYYNNNKGQQKQQSQQENRYNHNHENNNITSSNNKTTKRRNNYEGNNSKNKETAEFKEDYDFETANAIIAKELANMDIAQDKKDAKEDDNGNKEVGGEICEDVDAAYYDKNKSFFDKISSEMIDRANGSKIVRPLNRKEERKMNVETFGVAENGIGSRNGNKWSRGSRFTFSKSSSSAGAGRGSYVEAVYRGSKMRGDSAVFSHHGRGATMRGGRGGSRRPVAVGGGGGHGDFY